MQFSLSVFSVFFFFARAFKILMAPKPLPDLLHAMQHFLFVLEVLWFGVLHFHFLILADLGYV